MSSTYSPAIDLSNINLRLSFDKTLLLYPLTITALGMFAISLSGLTVYVKICVIIIFVTLLYLLLAKSYIFKPIKILKVKKDRWFLEFEPAKEIEVRLNAKSVVSSFALYLVFDDKKKKHPLVIRRAAVDKLQYDALYVYLTKVWQANQ